MESELSGAQSAAEKDNCGEWSGEWTAEWRGVESEVKKGMDGGEENGAWTVECGERRKSKREVELRVEWRVEGSVWPPGVVLDEVLETFWKGFRGPFARASIHVAVGKPNSKSGAPETVGR